MSNGTKVELDGTKAQITEKVFDHLTDGLCATVIGYAAISGQATPVVVGGLVSIALGKRVMNGPTPN